jgi:hypothetical protein
MHSYDSIYMQFIHVSYHDYMTYDCNNLVMIWN